VGDERAAPAPGTSRPGPAPSSAPVQPSLPVVSRTATAEHADRVGEVEPANDTGVSGAVVPTAGPRMHDNGNLPFPDGVEAACDPTVSKVSAGHTSFNVPFPSYPRAPAVEEVCMFVDGVASAAGVELCGLHLIKSRAGANGVTRSPRPSIVRILASLSTTKRSPPAWTTTHRRRLAWSR
jgi:hypothetical protein